jgi:hypothetical protein
MLGKLLERLGSQYFDGISLVYKDLSFYCETIEHQSIEPKQYLNVGGAIACILQLDDRSFVIQYSSKARII